MANGTKKEIENCDIYSDLNNDTNFYGCSKCKFGYRGRVMKDAADTKGYIEYCEKFDDCDTTVVGGLNIMTDLEGSFGPLNTYMSCFACKNDKLLLGFFNIGTGELFLEQF